MGAAEPSPAMASGAIAQLRNIQKTFGKGEKPALAELTADVFGGRITGLVGPDGAGKTTLIRLLAGLMAPSSGTITVDGLDPIADADRVRAIVGYMPQKFGLYEDLTVAENLDLYADLRNVTGQARKETFQRLLQFTDLAQFTGRPAGKLSGGMKQKLGLACTLLGKPKVLLLDEASVGVDPISRRELWRMVQALVSEGMAVLWSTSYLDEAELCADVLLLNEGRLLFNGPPKDLTDRVKDRCRLVRGIDGSRRQVLARALRLPEVLDGVIQGSNIRLLLRNAAREPSLADLNAGPEAQWTSGPPRFEDGFIDILGGGPGGHSVLAEHLSVVPLAGEVVIEARELTRKFGSFTAADHVNFQVRGGEIFGLLGPNGAGKSTTFKMMCGLLVPTSGLATVMGIDLKQSASEARQKIGYMAQKFSLYGSLTVGQNLQFFAGIYGLHGARKREAIEQMIAVFSFGPLIQTKADELPLGFKQRLALACAVMHEPPLLFLDEPTSGVDPVTRREFWTHINGAVEKGVTVMVTTHFMDEAEYCDRIGLVYRGKLIATGTPDALKKMAARPGLEEPTMEDAFIELVGRHPD
jgi:ABC-2 type transport system ATP-binding protein